MCLNASFSPVCNRCIHLASYFHVVGILYTCTTCEIFLEKLFSGAAPQSQQKTNLEASYPSGCSGFVQTAATQCVSASFFSVLHAVRAPVRETIFKGSLVVKKAQQPAGLHASADPHPAGVCCSVCDGHSAVVRSK